MILFPKLSVFHEHAKAQLIVVEGGDSLGISVRLETPQEQSDEEAQATPPGKRPSATEINVAKPCT
ncbi:hypothetical protein HMPREF9372_0888 [Sporosarcina newyorkensis 2681]|uniref:Uncharacterized protein n=1 Tax=Sporosarcina newyorkensis 2681 TaxID=1027292 RepID=F9DQ08_9BACL|nr:hypothetical protein HMPREF9372_0888 [Sporosarcina newyorkensis 2681]